MTRHPTNSPTSVAAPMRTLWWLVGAILVAALSAPTVAAGDESYSISYAGRLTQANGAPADGPLDIDVTFWNASTSGEQLGRRISKAGVSLSNGLFTLDLPLTGSDIADVFGDGARAVYIEITAGGKTYPRQRYMYIPLALRIPVDDSHFEFSDTSGKLRIKMDSGATDGSVMTSDGRGGIAWKKIDAAQLVAKSDTNGAPVDNQVLKYINGKWVAADITEASNAVNSITGLAPITVAGTSTAPTVSIAQASGTTAGYLSSADWQTFHAKEDALGFTPLNKAGDTLGGALNMNGKTLTGLATPADATDAASKSYVDGLALRRDGATPLTAAWNVGAKDIVNTGNIGIGSTEPSAKVDVVGQIKIQGGSPGAGKVLTSDASGLASWMTPAVGSVTTVNTGVGLTGGPITGTGTINLADTSVTPGTYTRATISVDQQGRLTGASSGVAIVDGDIDIAANIAQSKISGLGTSLAGKEPTINGGSLLQYWRGDKSWQTLNSDAVTEGTNQYFTAARAKAVLTASEPLSYSVTTGDISIGRATSTSSGYLSSTDWNTFNGKQSALGFTPLNRAGDTITGDLLMASAKVFGLSANATDPSLSGDADEGKIWFNSTSNELKYWDGSTVKTLGVAGSGLQSFNGEMTNSQTLATPGSTGTAPNWDSTGGVHTLHIPMASAASVSAGLISNSDYVLFSTKVNSVAAGNGIAVTAASGTATVALQAIGGAGTFTKVATDLYGRVTYGSSLTTSDIPPLSTGAIASGIFNVANGGTGSSTLTANAVLLGNGTSALQAVAPGTIGNVLTSNGTTWESSALPSTAWATPGTIGSTTPNSGAFTSVTSNAQAGYEARPYGILTGNTGETRFSELAANGTNFVGFKAPDVIGANTTWVLPSADGTAGQVLKTDGLGNLSWVSTAVGSVTNVTGTAPISVATGSSTPVISISQSNGTTSGFLSAADWTTFNAKQAAGNYITQLTGDMTLSGFASGTATATLPSVAIAGTSTKVSYDVKGRVLSGTSLAAADIPALSAGIITSGTLNVANGGTGAISLATNHVILGNGTSPVQAVAPGSSGNVLTSNGTTWQSTAPITNWNTSGSDVYRNSGNVGIGTTSPLAMLDVVKSGTNDPLLRVGGPNVTDNPAIMVQNGSGSTGLSMFAAGTTSAFLSNSAVGDVGLRRTGTGNMLFGTGGSAAALAISSSGNVGIGTTSPTKSLHVSGSNTNDISIRLTNSAGTGADFSIGALASASYAPGAFSIWDNNANAPRFNISSTGNVGIGTTSPLSKLHVQNTGTANPTMSGEDSLVVSSTGGVGYWNAVNVVAGDQGVSRVKFSSGSTNGAGAIGYLNQTNSMNFITNNTERVRIDSNGNVGIGTASPAERLHVTSNVRIGASANDTDDNADYKITSGGQLWLQANDSSTTDPNFVYLILASGNANTTVSHGVQISTKGSTRMMVDQTGNVGVGSISPAQKLDVAGNIKTTGAVVYNTLQDFRLVVREDFDSAATGWANNTRTTCGSATLLGGYNAFSNGNVYKDFDLTGIPHTEVMVRLTYYFIDSWDGESAYIQVGGISTFYKSHIASAVGLTNICGIASADHVAATESRISHSTNSLRILIGSTLDQAASDESFGVDNVEIWVR